MDLENLHSILYDHNINTTVNHQRNRLEIKDSSEFDQYITIGETGILKVEVYLANKTTKDSITKADFRECMKMRDELVERLNSLSLPVAFNFFGESE